ncbi:MAG TPA: PAS domain-containing sensor histidine kinase [Pyrinomonadaceae bacterium]|nr:PAS domain-containing sensor histidine kinase [Pyrinomonadaceae bacterium]
MRSRRTILLFVWLTLTLSPLHVAWARNGRSAPATRSRVLLIVQSGQTATRSILDQRSGVVLIAIAIIVLQAIVIVMLLRERNRQKRAVTKFADSEERFAKVFRVSPQPMVITTLKEGRILDVNESALKMSGHSREDIIGRTSLEIGVFSSHEHRKATIGSLMQTGSVRNMELQFPMKNGATRLLLCSAQVIDLSGEQCIVLASSDITERKEAEQQLAQLSARLLQTQDEERRRIARELHDVTAQSIGLIMLNLAQVQNAASSLDSRSRDKLTESLAFGEQALKDIRTLSYILHPPLLDQAGLITALKWYVKGFHERSGVKVDFTDTGNEADRMPPEVEYALFRVVQECLTNIRRHTNSETAEINLSRTGETISLSVRDHGKGHKLEIAKNGDSAEFVGVGIPGMRHRIKQLGGELIVDSSLEGTTVTATVPVRWGGL